MDAGISDVTNLQIHLDRHNEVVGRVKLSLGQGTVQRADLVGLFYYVIKLTLGRGSDVTGRKALGV